MARVGTSPRLADTFGTRRRLRLALAFVLAGPLLLGGATPGTAALCLLGAAAGLALAASTEECVPTTVPMRRILLAFSAVIVLVLLQRWPLPCALTRLLTGDARAEHVSRVAGLLGTEPTCTVTTDPGRTTSALALACAALASAWVGSTAARRLGRTTVLRGVTIVSALVAAVTLVHAVFALRAVYGWYEPRHATYGILSPLLNGNHLAAVMVMSIPCAAATLLGARTSRDRAFLLVALGLSIMVCVMARSRGGLLGILVVGVASLHLAKTSRRSFRTDVSQLAYVLGTGLGAGAIGFIVLAVDGGDVIADFRDGPYKTGLILDALRFAVDEGGPLGVGRGAFAAAFPSASTAHRAMHPENLVAQWTSELGVVPGLALLVAFAIPLLRRLSAENPTSARLGAVALIATALHDLGDFALEMPGVAIPFAAVYGAVTVPTHTRERTSRTTAPSSFGWNASPFVLLAAIVVTTGFALQSDATRHLDALSSALRQRSPEDAHRATERALGAHPFDPAVLVLAAEAARITDDPRTLAYTNLARTRAPGWMAPHETAYRYLVHHGRSAQAIAELAAIAAVAPQHAASTFCALRPRETDPYRLSRAIPDGEGGAMMMRELRRCAEADALAGIAREAFERTGHDRHLALAYLRVLRDAEGLAAARSVLAGFAPPLSDAPELLLLGARFDLEAGDGAAAIERLRRVASRAPDPAEFHDLEARAHARLGRRDATERSIRAAAQTRTDAEGLLADALLRADCAAELDDPIAEAEALVDAYERSPRPTVLDRLDALARETNRPALAAWVAHRRCEDQARCLPPDAPPALEPPASGQDTAVSGAP